ncbi:hypothetical protein ACXYTP_09665 [Tsukamurella ocularis]|uniref:hypothetical protein n=1 Tax=Tsukamurella ocularis TaxID=1970234 RepID=UPI0039EEBDAA
MGDWTRPPAELFMAVGRLVAATDSRWMFATLEGERYRYSMKDSSGRTVGEDFLAEQDACARTRSGILGCQIGDTFDIVDFATATHVRRAMGLASGQYRGPIPLADGWVVGGGEDFRVLSDSGHERWRVPHGEIAVGQRSSFGSTALAIVVTTEPGADKRRVRDAATGAVVAECSCVVTMNERGFATEFDLGFGSEAPARPATVYALDGRSPVTLAPGELPIPGGSEALIATPTGKAGVEPTFYRVRTAAGRDVWQGTSSNGPPRACRDWLLAPDGVVSIKDGARSRRAMATGAGYNCLGAGQNWIAMPDEVIVPDGVGWRPNVGSLRLVDGLLANVIRETEPAARVVVYSPTGPAPTPLPESADTPVFSVALPFTFPPGPATIDRTTVTSVAYDPAKGRWSVGGEGITLAGKAVARHPARERFVVSDHGDVTGTLPPSDGARPCGPYSVALADDISRVVIRRDDGGQVGIGAQPDPGHVVAAGAQCVGYSADHLALALQVPGTGITLLPLHDGARALRLPNATGFASGRPFATTYNEPTLTVFPAVR